MDDKENKKIFADSKWMRPMKYVGLKTYIGWVLSYVGGVLTVEYGLWSLVPTLFGCFYLAVLTSKLNSQNGVLRFRVKLATELCEGLRKILYKLTNREEKNE